MSGAAVLVERCSYRVLGGRMRKRFPGYYRDHEVDLAIRETLVVFDASVLLNLYRYPSDASQDLLELMEALSDKVWIPYHAALEYQRNRLAVIADQRRRFREVRQVVEGGVSTLKGELDKLQLRKRHSTIDITDLTTSLDSAVDRFLKSLEHGETEQRDVTDEDPIRDRLDALFRDRVGSPPQDQNWVDGLEKEGQRRYEALIPPGFMDATKETSSFTDRGLVYRSQFGDLVLWRQIAEHARGIGAKQLVFVTDDEKADWWLIVESGGSKRIGPRPELIGELTQTANVDRFFMYSSERFAQSFACRHRASRSDYRAGAGHQTDHH
jgi:hypothetical protein